ncbi:MAG TPA: glycosyltransferase, partial [Armatimonadota bacterium]|nr:glycosyltransferase [Armatimonadota bacterium]
DAEPTSAEEIRPVVLASQLGYITVGEKLDPQDWNLVHTAPDGTQVRRTPAAVTAALLADVRRDADDSNILLLHDGGGDRSLTLELLRLAIPRLRKQGFRFVPVSYLAGLDRARVMPRLSSKDVVLLGADRVTFATFFTTEAVLRLGFFCAIILGIARILFIVPLALAERRRERQHPPSGAFQPPVSVLIAAFNERPVIARTLHSILRSDYPSLGIVVVDDGSTDGTADAVEAEFRDDPRVRLVRKPNGGKASALNCAIQHARGSVLVGLDADTQIARTTVSLLVRHFARPEVGAVAGNVKVGNRVNLLTRWQAVEYITSQNLDRRAYSFLNAITVVPGAVGAWRREAVQAVGGYLTDTLAEDMDLTWRMRRAGWRLVTESGALAFTEAPDHVHAFWKQRFRWAYGTLQCLWKHRGALGRHGCFG